MEKLPVKPSKPLKPKAGDTVTAWYVDGCGRRHDFREATVVKREPKFGGWRLDVGGFTLVLPAAQITVIDRATPPGSTPAAGSAAPLP